MFRGFSGLRGFESTHEYGCTEPWHMGSRRKTHFPHKMHVEPMTDREMVWSQVSLQDAHGLAPLANQIPTSHTLCTRRVREHLGVLTTPMLNPDQAHHVTLNSRP